MYKFEMPQLSYSFDALEPVISERTMQFHYGKHLQTYLDNLNRLIESEGIEGDSLEQIIMVSTGALFNNAAQVFNHTFFFENLCAEASDELPWELLAAIAEYFGSFEEFKLQFEGAAMSQFGSGWAWLSKAKDGSLVISTTSNAVTPMNEELRPILTVDLWEHAYYLDYQNRRAEYLSKIWSKINWRVVYQRFLK